MQMYIVTEADSVSVLQLCHMCVGAYGMLVSSVYEQTICSYIRINMWVKGVRTYVGTLMVYVSMMILAFLALITIFIYAGIFEQTFAFVSLPIFLLFVFLHFTRGAFDRARKFLLGVVRDICVRRCLVVQV